MSTIETAIRLNDNMSNVLYQIMGAVNLSISAMGDLNQSLENPINTDSFDSAVSAIDAATAALREMDGVIQAVSGQSVTVTAQVQNSSPSPAEWQSYGGIEVFQTDGAYRYREEINSINQMMTRLSETQDEITRNSYHSNVLPPQAANDMIALNSRIQEIGRRIQDIFSRPIRSVSPQELSQLEQLRAQMNSALQLQNQINRAVDNMDVDGANQAYLQLSQTVSNTERYIRDNVNEQGRFNQAINNGASMADGLMNKIKGVAGAFLGVQGAKKAMDMSDELTSMTARLNQMNDGAQTTPQLLNMTYQAAEDARGSLDGMAALVTRLGNNARDAFSSNQEVIAFSTLIQKQMTIAGASTQEASSAMIQLSQALSSGVLRGDELNSIFEQAPNIIQSIADYLDVPIGQIRNMAAEGQISAAVVKAAIFDSADEINEKFNRMPKTWGQIWQNMKNQATMALQPVFDKISELANSAEVQNGVNAIISAFSVVGEVAVSVLGIVAEVAAFTSENWSVIAPIVIAAAIALGIYSAALAVHKASVAASTLAQQGFNVAMVATKALTAAAAVLAVVTAVALLTNAVNDAYGTSFSFAGMLGSVLMTVLAGLGNIVIMVYNIVVEVVLTIWNCIANFINFFANVWSDPIGSVVRLFISFSDTILSIVQSVASAIDGVFGTKLASGISDFRTKINGMVTQKFGEGKVNVKVDEKAASIGYIKYSEAADAGYWLGEKIAGVHDNDSAGAVRYTLDDIYSGVEGIGDNTSAIRDGLDVTSEELKYLRDLAEMEVVNRFTTAEIKVEMTNNNNVSGGMDLDGIVVGLIDAVNEAVDEIAEGVHA